MAVAKVEFRKPFAYDAEAVSRETGIVCSSDTLTVQADKDECDINTLVKRFGITGQMPLNMRPPMQGDFTGISDYQSALNALNDADEKFMELPADVRKRFDHDPGAFVEFCSDPGNVKELRELGLAVPEETPVMPLEVRVIADPPAPE